MFHRKNMLFLAHLFISFILIFSQIAAAGFALLLVFPDLRLAWVAPSDLVSDHLLDAQVTMQKSLYLFYD